MWRRIMGHSFTLWLSSAGCWRASCPRPSFAMTGKTHTHMVTRQTPVTISSLRFCTTAALCVCFAVREILPLNKWCSCRGLLNPPQSDRAARYSKVFLRKNGMVYTFESNRNEEHVHPGTWAVSLCLFMCLRVAALGERRPLARWLEGWERITRRSCPPVQGASGDSLCSEGATRAPCPSWRRAALSRMTGQPRSPVCDCPTRRTVSRRNNFDLINHLG